MANYAVVVYSCGHEEKVQCPVDWAGTKQKMALPCPMCQKKIGQNDALQPAPSKLIKLHQLKGTEKQEKWASQIRSDVIKQYQSNDKIRLKLEQICKTEVKAKFWIDHRTQLKDEEYILNFEPTTFSEKSSKAKQNIEIKPDEVYYAAHIRKIRECTIDPSLYGFNKINENVIEIAYIDGRMCIETVNDIREFIQNMYMIDNKWVKEMTKEEYNQLAIELSCSFIENGYKVAIINNNIRKMIIDRYRT